MNVVKLDSRDRAFTKLVEKESGQNLSACYQCGKCSAGCPASFLYDKQVSQIMRACQAGLKKESLDNRSLWLCLSCSTCSARCPNNIDVAKIMDVLRHIARSEGIVKDRPVEQFWKAFLDAVKTTGRSYEIGIMADYMLRTARFYTDLDIAIPALKRGKLPFKPHFIQGREEVSRIFKRYEEAKIS